MTRQKKRKKNKIIIFFSFLFILSINNSFADNCEEFKKFSVEYLKCKGNSVKDKTISVGKNIIKDTKDYQDKEWSEGKKKINKAKDKINETKKKVLD
tara:strand:+ start:269 stop:559 length:291 start_codon:yes stop_codon:yes gene_type:complete